MKADDDGSAAVLSEPDPQVAVEIGGEGAENPDERNSVER